MPTLATSIFYTALFSVVRITANPLNSVDEEAGGVVKIRSKRYLGQCKWNQPAVSACFEKYSWSTGSKFMYCGNGYSCDAEAGGDGRGRCCLQNIYNYGANTLPVYNYGGYSNYAGAQARYCTWGQPANGYCTGGVCADPRYQCEVNAGAPLCCLPDAPNMIY